MSYRPRRSAESATSNGADTLTMLLVIRQSAFPLWNFCAADRVEGGLNRREALMFRWAVICSSSR